MIWRRKDPAENNFPTFHHQDARIEALEADFLMLNHALLDYIGDIAPMIVTHGSATHLVDTLQTIIKTRVGLSEK